MTSRRSANAFALRQGVTFALHAVLLLAFAGSARAQDAFRFALLRNNPQRRLPLSLNFR